MVLRRNRHEMIFVLLLSFFLLANAGCDGGSPANGCGGDSGLVMTPNLQNLDETEAHSAITGAGLTLGTISTGCSDTVSAGKVTRQAPAAGQRVDPETNVDIVISDGLLCNVHFPDPVLRRAIQNRLHIDAGQPIPESALKTIEILPAHNDFSGLPGIRNLDGIQYCSNLTRLYLSNNSVTDISPLSGLINLQFLGANLNPISDIEPLSGLTNLRYLYLSGFRVSNIDAIAGLTNLEALVLGSAQNRLKDISVLGRFTKLRSLEMNEGLDSSIDNIDVLAGLTHLEDLRLRNNFIVNIEALATLDHLEYLDLNGNAVADIGPLVENAGMCLIKEGSPFETVLYLEDNPLNAISCDSYIPELMDRGHCEIIHPCDEME